MDAPSTDNNHNYFEFVDFMETHSLALKSNKLLSDLEISDGANRDGIIQFDASNDEITIIWLRENNIQQIKLSNNSKITHLLSILHALVTKNLTTHNNLISKYFHKNEISKIFKQIANGTAPSIQIDQVFLDLLDTIEIWSLHNKIDPYVNDIFFDNHTDSRFTIVLEKSRETGNFVGKFVLDNKKSKTCLKNLHKIQQIQTQLHTVSHNLQELYTFSFDEDDVEIEKNQEKIDLLVEEISLFQIEIDELLNDIKTHKKHSILQSVKKSFKKMMAKKRKTDTLI